MHLTAFKFLKTNEYVCLYGALYSYAIARHIPRIDVCHVSVLIRHCLLCIVYRVFPVVD